MWRNWYTHSTQNAARNHVGSSPTISTKGGFTRTREKHCYKRVQSNPKIKYHIISKSQFTLAYFLLFLLKFHKKVKIASKY